MSQKEDNSNKFLKQIIVPLLVGTTILFIEYWSGYFYQSPGAKPVWSVPTGSLTAISIALLVITLFATTQCLLVWLQPDLHRREDFAFVGTFLILCLSASVAICVLNRVMPWSAVNIAMERINSGTTPQPGTTKWSDYALLLLLYLLVVWAIIRNHSRWSGLKSVDQYHREQRSESVSLFVEGFREFKRLIQRRPPLKTYNEKDAKDFITQLEPVSDSLSWRDQAKDLLCLSSSSYSFDPDKSWHDLEGCWLGANLNTNGSIFLFPFQGELTDRDIDRFCENARVLSSKNTSKIDEIIIAVREKAEYKPARDGFRLRYTSEAELLDGLVDFKDYFADIKRRAAINTLPDSNLVLTEVYVPSKISDSGKWFGSDVEQFLDFWLNDPSQRHLALLGEYGQGKSTAALMWAFHQISIAYPPPNLRTPLVIELRGTSPRNLTPLQMLGAWGARYNLNAQALMRLVSSGRITLIFEGFDEMALVGDASMRLNHFRTLWQFAYPRAKVLITGRPNLFLDEEEMKAALGISKPVADSPYCEAIRLKPFTPDQIYEALRPYNDLVRTQIHELAIRNDRFHDIVSRPSLLHIVSVLWEKERLFEKVDELTSAVVMDLFVRQSYRRQGLKETDSPDFMALTTAEREYFMEGIAAYMGHNELPNQISARELNQIVENLISVIPDSVSTESKAITGETNEPLRSRIENNEYGRDHVTTDVRACGLLVDDPSAPGTFRFGHKSFMEYLFAVVIDNAIQKKDSEKTRAIFRTVNARIEDILNLPVAVDFLCELLIAEMDAVDRSAEHSKTERAKHMLRIILGPNYLRFFVRRLLFLNEVLGFSISQHLVLAILILAFSVSAVSICGVLLFNHQLSSATARFLIPLSLIGSGVILSLLLSLGSHLLTKKKLRLWIKLCRSMDLPERSLHRVLGTWLIPRISADDLNALVETQKA